MKTNNTSLKNAFNTFFDNACYMKRGEQEEWQGARSCRQRQKKTQVRMNVMYVKLKI